MQTITLQDVRTAGRAAYEAGTLTAQSANPACVYVDENGCRCVVGSAMNDRTIETIRFRKQLETRFRLLTDSAVYVPKGELQDIIDLQSSHDRWCQAVEAEGRTSPEACHAQENFRRLLYK